MPIEIDFQLSLKEGGQDDDDIMSSFVWDVCTGSNTYITLNMVQNHVRLGCFCITLYLKKNSVSGTPDPQESGDKLV